MKTGIKYLLVTLLVLAAFPSMAQLETYLELVYTQKSDGKVEFRSVLEDDDGEMVKGATVRYYSVLDESESSIGEAETNSEGVALLLLDNLSGLDMDSSHSFTVRAEFAGNSELETSEDEGTWKEIMMSLELKEEEEEKIVGVQLNAWDEQGELYPVEEGEVYFYVPRLFSLLPIGDAWTEEEGYDEIKFPSDLPGDQAGLVTVIARLEEHEEFGNVETQIDTNWGVIPTMETSLPRALWSTRPPLWMVITFVVLILAVELILNECQ